MKSDDRERKQGREATYRGRLTEEAGLPRPLGEEAAEHEACRHHEQRTTRDSSVSHTTDGTKNNTQAAGKRGGGGVGRANRVRRPWAWPRRRCRAMRSVVAAARCRR